MKECLNETKNGHVNKKNEIIVRNEIKKLMKEKI